MTGFRWLALTGVACGAAWLIGLAAAEAAPASQKHAKAQTVMTDVSAQTRRVRRRAPTRIEVRPLRRAPERLYPDSYRECVPVMVERWIPQWGGRVIHASQRCWWTRG